MIIYSNTKQGFVEDMMDGVLDEKIDKNMRERFGKRTPEGEMRAWRNSLSHVGNILQYSKLPDTTGIAIEYNIPYTSKRVDMIVSGKTSDDRYSAIIIELKQWSSAKSVKDKDAVVLTELNGYERETAHPSYQAWSYATAIMDFNADVQDNDVLLKPCAYLHNYTTEGEDPLLDPVYEEYLEQAPVFNKHHGKGLKEFMERFIKKGDRLETIFMLDSGRLRPSKSLQDVLSSMMEGNQEFTLLDSQKVVYESILGSARKINKGGKKDVVIVKGGPGTGKTVLAVNLLCTIIKEGMSSIYVSKNAAPRNVYRKKLKGKMKSSSVNMLFKGPDKFYTYENDKLDVALVDEAHRLREKSGTYGVEGENQIKEIIAASKLSVFFIDDEQIVTLKDVGSVDTIRSVAKEAGIKATVLELDSQFRCAGSDGYLAWLDNILDIRETAETEFDPEWGYDFKVFYDPNEMRDAIREKNLINDRCRIVAGYCWNWPMAGRNDPSVHDITIPDYDFEMSWNLSSTDSWAIDMGSIDQAGCIHTCQGLEFDYVGVIIGDDLRFEDGRIITDASKRAKTDQSLKGLKSNYTEEEGKIVADKIIKDTYRVLMSRGMKGCYVYCTDRALAEYLDSGMHRNPSHSSTPIDLE